MRTQNPKLKIQNKPKIPISKFQNTLFKKFKFGISNLFWDLDFRFWVSFKRGGFTLVETVLVIALLGVLAFALGPALSESFKSYDLIQARRAVLMEAKGAFERMVREIRLIESPSDVLDVSSSTSFQFEYPNNTPITYNLSGTNLLRNGAILADNISSLSFLYYDSAGNLTGTAANVRRIQIQATFDSPGGKPGITLRSSTFLRNAGGDFSGFAAQ